MQFRVWAPLLALAFVASAACLLSTPCAAAPRVDREKRRSVDAASTPSTLNSAPTTAAAMTAPPTSPAPTGPYWANASLLGVEVSCDGAAKRCLGVGRLPHGPGGRCYPVGDRRPCGDGDSTWVLDAAALEEGRVRGKCRPDDSCNYTMAFDGACHDPSQIYSDLCDYRASIVRHPTGGWECLCPPELCPREETELRQPVAPGKCVLPDFQRRHLPSFRVACTPAEAQCLTAFALPFGGTCVKPLNRSVCAEGQWLTLDERAAEKGRLRASCAAEWPCGAGSQLLHDDGRCHSEEELRDTLCPNETVLPLPTGNAACTVDDGFFVLKGTEEAGVCEVYVLIYEYLTEIRTGFIMCSFNNDGECPPEVSASGASAARLSSDEN